MKAFFTMLLSSIVWLASTILAPSQTPTPEQLGKKEHAKLAEFVNWMRQRDYPENVISKWVDDYLSPAWHATVFACVNDSVTKLTYPLTIKYYDVLPTDAGAEPLFIKVSEVEALLKQCYGITVKLDYQPLYVSYKSLFPYEVKSWASGSGVFFDFKKVKEWALKQFASSVIPYSTSKDMVHFGITKLDGVPIVTTILAAGAPLVFVGSENPELAHPISIYTHAHEWAHAWGVDHRYGFGTFGPLSDFCKKGALENVQIYSVRMDPLTAYQLEPLGGYEFPELVYGQAYADYLKPLLPCETPYTVAPAANMPVILAQFYIDNKYIVPRLCLNPTSRIDWGESAWGIPQ